jgi:flavin reductase (DIM6/NTAB) family NADH-FMN oxidoreductase RutF
MRFDMAALAPHDRYKLMSSSITPRPIAWVTSQSKDGVRNAAPYSFFNMMAADPPLIVLGLMARPEGSFKDSAANILETGEFVVNLVSEDDVAAMNFTCIDAPPEFDELEAAGIATLPSVSVVPPRIASAPASLECRLFQAIRASATSTVVLGQVVTMHIDDRFIDPERLHVDTLAMKLVARMHGAGWYTRSIDLFQLERPVWANWSKAQNDGA